MSNDVKVLRVVLCSQEIFFCVNNVAFRVSTRSRVLFWPPIALHRSRTLCRLHHDCLSEVPVHTELSTSSGQMPSMSPFELKSKASKVLTSTELKQNDTLRVIPE